jgi:hypothetical protein
MVKARKIGIIAALGSSTAALAMLTGLAGARADELQLNQQLLDQRIDQIAAGQGAGGGGNDQFSVTPNAAAGAPVTGGSFPRSILIPGTDTSIKIYGQITEIVDYYLSGGPPNQSPQSTTVGTTGNLESLPLATTTGLGGGPGNSARARSNGIFQQSPKESKIGFETRTPTPLGEERTVMEFDWAGSSTFVPGGAALGTTDSLVPRLRYAYGTLGGLLAGQATSNFADPDGTAETLDFGGPAGLPGKGRVPQIRYTMPAWWGASFSVSADTPETTAATPVSAVLASDGGAYQNATPTSAVTTPFAANPLKASAPILTSAWYYPAPWGHFDMSAVLLPGEDVSDGKFVSRDFIGYGGHIGADFKPGWFGWVKDDFVLQFEVGSALGPYVNASTSAMLETNYPVGVGAPATAAAAAAIIIHPVTEIGGQLGYQHFWLDNLRSTIAGGFEGINLDEKIVGPNTSLNKELITGHANLIWNPVSSVDIGVEYTWGQRTAVTNMHGTQNVMISKFAFRF